MRIWLTGGSGSGKSEAARLFAAHGFSIVDADKIAREIVMPKSPALEEIRKAFGDDFLMPDGTLHRKKLGEAVFGDDRKLAKLEAITHKYIIAEMERQGKGKKNVVFDAPLRNTFGISCDKTLVITAPREARIRRIIGRDAISEEAATARIGAQDAEAAYEADADAVLQNDGDLDFLQSQVKKYIKEWFTP